MTKTNRIICYVVACILLLCVAVLMFGCKKGETAETRVMNMSINPEVEFILDKGNKVVSVSAKNDEGNFIVAKATFVGLSAEEAAKLFVEVTNENGFVVEAGDLKIEISGKDAQKIFDRVKNNINVYLGEEGLNIPITLDKIDRKDLEGTLKDCMKELSDEEIAKLTEDEIIAKVQKMREQTKDLNTEKLKEMYYEFRAQAIEEAKFEAYFDALENMPAIKAMIETQYNAFISKLNDMKTKFVEEFMSQTSDYQQRMQQFITAKRELLQARLDKANGEMLAAKEATVTAAKNALELAENAAENTINSGLSKARDALDAAIETIVSQLPTEINATINVKIGEAKAGFEASFKTDYEAYINENYWDGLAPTQKAGA